MWSALFSVERDSFLRVEEADRALHQRDVIVLLGQEKMVGELGCLGIAASLTDGQSDLSALPTKR